MKAYLKIINFNMKLIVKINKNHMQFTNQKYMKLILIKKTKKEC